VPNIEILTDPYIEAIFGGTYSLVVRKFLWLYIIYPWEEQP
jgi:hypothetical protein